MISLEEKAAQIYMAERQKIWNGPPIDPIDKRKWVTNYLTNRFDELLGSGWREHVRKLSVRERAERVGINLPRRDPADYLGGPRVSPTDVDDHE